MRLILSSELETAREKKLNKKTLEAVIRTNKHQLN